MRFFVSPLIFLLFLPFSACCILLVCYGPAFRPLFSSFIRFTFAFTDKKKIHIFYGWLFI